MTKRNPVLSMSGNMWERLIDYRARGSLSSKHAAACDATDRALIARGFLSVSEQKLRCTHTGRMVADAYHEGQESKA